MPLRVAIFAVVAAALLIGGGALALTMTPTYAFEMSRVFEMSPPFVDPSTIAVAMTVVGVRAERVIALYALSDFLGVRRSQIAEAVKRGLLHPFTPLGGRRKVVLESEVAALQARAIAEAAATAEAAKAAAANAVPIEVKPATPAPVGRKRKPATAERALTA